VTLAARASNPGRVAAWLPAIAWATLIFSLSSRSVVPEPAQVAALPLHDKFEHFTEYGVLSLFVLLGLRRGPRLPRPISPDFHPHLAFMIATVFAYTDEVHQWFVPLRQADVLDFLADGFGAFVVAFVLSLYLTPAPPPAKPPNREARLNFGRISFQVAGEGPPILYLHGWHGSKRYWSAAPRELPGFRHIAPDLLGFGDSPSPARFSYSPREQAEVALTLARSLGVNSAIVVGHSMGAAVGVELALCDPSFVEALVLVEPALRLPAPYPFLLTKEELRGVGVGFARHFLGLKVGPLVHFYVEDPKAFSPALLEDALSVPLHASVRSLAQLWRADLVLRLKDLRCEVLLVYGDAAHHARALHGRLLNNDLPHSALLHLPHTSHCPMIEAPEDFYKSLRAFIERAHSRPGASRGDFP
jgi:pimeloyl-ACP methyl ester carboxylesterase